MTTTYIVYPPLKRPTGGGNMLLRMASVLHSSGYPVQLTAMEGGTEVMKRLAPGVPAMLLRDARPSEDDIWLVPEGWASALVPGMKNEARCMIYCQGWSLLFSGLPESVDWRDLEVDFLAVSEPVSLFIQSVLGKKSHILRPAIDQSLFTFAPKKKDRELTIAYMPRKNRSFVNLIRHSFSSRNKELKVTWLPIENTDPAGVARMLKQSHIFLHTAFPEGCPLPPLEAMACGCVVVGFAGFGGWDYMRQIDPQGCVPWFGLRDVPWEGNGFWAEDGDVLRCTLYLEQAAALCREGGAALEAVQQAGGKTLAEYGLEEQKQACLSLWSYLAGEQKEKRR